MWKLSRECSSKYFLNSSSYPYFISRSKAHDAVAREFITEETSISRAERNATRLPSWFILNEDDRAMPIFVTPKAVSSPNLTDQFGLLCTNQPSTSKHPCTSIERGPFAAAFIPTTYGEDTNESRLVNNPRECDGMDVDIESRKLFERGFPSKDAISPVIRRRAPMRAIRWHTRGAVRGIKQTIMHRLRPRRHVLNSWRTMPCRTESSTNPTQSTVDETDLQMDEECEGPFLLSKLNACSYDHVDLGQFVSSSTPASTSTSVQQDVEMKLKVEENVKMKLKVEENVKMKLKVEESVKMKLKVEESVKMKLKVEGGEACAELSEELKERGPTISKTIFDPLEVRSEQVPLHMLRELTKEKDVEGLRMALNEYRWPHFESMKGFISELFQVFIERGLNVDEVKRLMWDFASTNNRAYVRDAVTISLLERIVREEGIQAATHYARLNRGLFLVKAPMERRHSKSVSHETERLFATVFDKADDKSDLESASKLLDTMMDLGYMTDNAPFLMASLIARLKRKGYTATQQLWTWHVLKYRTTLGVHLLLREALHDSNVSSLVQHKRIGHVLSVCEQYDHPFAGLAELIVELSRAHVDVDAAYLLTRLSISGSHFRRPLNRMRDDESNVVYVEQLANLVSECMMPRRKKRASNKTTPQSDSDTSLTERTQPQTVNKPTMESGAIGSCVANRMFAKREKRSSYKKKLKKHKVDVEKLHELSINLQRIWADLAVKSHDKSSLTRLWEWSVNNKLDANLRQNRRFRNIFESNSTKA